MALFNLYIYNKNGTLLFHRDWVGKKKQSCDMTTEEVSRLLYGMLFSLQSFATRISPEDKPADQLSYKTNKYMLTLFQTPTGLKFVCNSDLSASNVRETLQKLYSQAYVECVVRNPMCQPGEPIQCRVFASRVDQMISQLHPSTVI